MHGNKIALFSRPLYLSNNKSASAAYKNFLFSYLTLIMKFSENLRNEITNRYPIKIFNIIGKNAEIIIDRLKYPKAMVLSKLHFFGKIF